ncbi:unnamed protein product [Rotaria sordida]|uniref:F-box domain-containing protein n=1 Tax=Rotaria sordida TaxID=392033 RepID=A0A815ESD6_9BILA|nr:unnamed protein product [Rotaria sordida]
MTTTINPNVYIELAPSTPDRLNIVDFNYPLRCCFKVYGVNSVTNTRYFIYDRKINLQQASITDGINLHLNSLPRQQQRYRLELTGEDNQQIKFKGITSITLKYDADDILYEIFSYLSPVDILQSFLLTKRLSRVIINEYLWHIHIGDSTISLLIFSNYCNNLLKLIGGRIVSLRLTLTNVIGGWSLISSYLRYHQTTLLQRLHLIDINPHEFDKLLRNQLIKQLHTLLVDVTPYNPFHCFQVEGIYLVKVCSRMPLLKICRLPFNHDDGNVNKIENYSLKYQITLPNLLSRNHLRTLTIGIHTSRFIERLLLSIPFIENLSFGIKDKDINENDDAHDKITLPAGSDAHLEYLSRLRIHCLNSISFHRTIALLSSVLSDIIQELCIDRLKPMATYSLSLLLYVEDDLEEKIIFNSFFKVPFIHRQSPRVFIQEYNDSDISDTNHCFMVYTFPYNDTILSSYIFSTNLEKFCQNPTDVTDLFPRANTLSFYGYNKTNCVRDLANCRSSISSLVPWLLLTNIKINHSDVITQHTLVSILGMGYNVHTLDIVDDRGILVRTILHNKDKFGTQINEQVRNSILK